MAAKHQIRLRNGDLVDVAVGPPRALYDADADTLGALPGEGARRKAKAAAEASITDALEIGATAARLGADMAEGFKAHDAVPERVELEFGLKVIGEVDVKFASAGAEADVRVRIGWDLTS